jgi:hypothetical protein
MFINEGNSNKYFEEATANPAYMYEAIQEANEAYHDLCMKMVKCEHAAIVNEDTSMLAEATGDFKEKVKRIAQTILAQFLAFIDKVRAEWSKLWAGLLSKLVNTEKAKATANIGETIEVKIDKNAIANATSLFNKIRAISVGANAEDTTLTQKLEEIKDALSKKEDAVKVEKVEAKMFTEALVFLIMRPNMIKDLEKFKAEGKKAYKATVEANNVHSIAC